MLLCAVRSRWSALPPYNSLMALSLQWFAPQCCHPEYPPRSFPILHPAVCQPHRTPRKSMICAIIKVSMAKPCGPSTRERRFQLMVRLPELSLAAVTCTGGEWLQVSPGIGKGHLIGRGQRVTNTHCLIEQLAPDQVTGNGRGIKRRGDQNEALASRVSINRPIISGQFSSRGAMACVGLVSLDEYLQELKHLQLSTCEQ